MASLLNAGREMTLTRTTIPRSIFDRAYVLDVDGAGPSVHFMESMHDELFRTMTPIELLR